MWFEVAKRELADGADTDYVIALLQDDGCLLREAEELVDFASEELGL